MALKRFSHKEHVLVLRDEDGNELNAYGVVERLRIGDNGAWIDIGYRRDADGAFIHTGKQHPNARHHFPADDEYGRGPHVLAYPEDCEAVR